jgi:hypothetical protein
MQENKLTDIFTEYDESIFSEGSIDPMGLRIIWTNLGNAIFHNKLNTISSDIRYYTLNLFHHFVINQVQKQNEDTILNIVGFEPFVNRTDLYDGLIIFLETLLTHVVLEMGTNQIVVPGLSKLSNLKETDPSNLITSVLPVDKKEGILVRHIGLGIHGRHKGPFQQIGIFDKNNYYGNETIWNDAEQLFTDASWFNLKDHLLHIIEEHVFNKKQYAVQVDDVKSVELRAAYNEALNSKNFQAPQLITFWEEKLGLTEGEAHLLYEQVMQSDGINDYESQIKSAAGNNNTPKLNAICAIEPLLTRIEKSTNRLLLRGTTDFGDELLKFMEDQLKDETIDISLIEQFLKSDVLDTEPLRRLKELVEIYDTTNPKDYVIGLISYHKKLFEQRNNLPWISYGGDKITQHRSFILSAKAIDELKNSKWVNDYYMSTVVSLYNGLHKQ